MINKIIIHGGSSDITKNLLQHLENEYDEFHIFCRNVRFLKNDINYDKKYFFYENDLNNFDKTKEDLEKLPNDLKSIFWASGYTGNVDREFSDQSKCEFTMKINFYNVVLCINYLLENKIDFSKKGFLTIISSVAGERGRARNLYYGACKAALTSYLSGIRQKFNNKLHVMTVVAGWMKTKNFKLNVPEFLVCSPEKSAKIIYDGIKKKKEIVYIDFKWRIIIFAIKLIPEKIFKKFKF